MVQTDLHLGAHEGAVVPPLSDDETAPTSPLDQLTNGIKAWFDVGITLGKSVDTMKASVDRLWNRLQQGTPIDYGTNASGVYPAAGNLVLNLGTPDMGTRWEVTNVVVGGSDQNVAAAGTAGLYVSGFLPPSGTTQSPGLTTLVDQAKTLPNVGFYGTRQLVVQDFEYLYLIVFGGTAGQIYEANASMTVFNVAAARGQVISES